MKKTDAEKSITEFLIEDFKDISAKLESTDKKVQFIVQIYTALVAAIISASLFFLANQFSKIADILKNNDVLKTNNIILPAFCIIYLFLLGFAVCVYLYSLKGNLTHSIYLSRMHFLRNKILKKIGVSTEKIENFFYTQKIIPTKVGMGTTLNIFLAFTINLYLSLIICLIWSLGFFCKLNMCIRDILIIINIIIISFHYYLIKIHYNIKAKEAINKGWEIENNESS